MTLSFCAESQLPMESRATMIVATCGYLVDEMDVWPPILSVVKPDAVNLASCNGCNGEANGRLEGHKIAIVAVQGAHVLDHALEALAEKVGRDYDAFDLIAHVAYDRPPLTRRERAENVRKRDYFTQYGEQARAVLYALLDKYANQGIRAIENMDVLKVQPLDELGTAVEIVGWFGGKEGYLDALRELEDALYSGAA